MAAGRQRAEELQRPRKRARLAPEEPERDLDFELVAAWPAARRVAPLAPGPMPQGKAGDALVRCIVHDRKRPLRDVTSHGYGKSFPSRMSHQCTARRRCPPADAVFYCYWHCHYYCNYSN